MRASWIAILLFAFVGLCFSPAGVDLKSAMQPPTSQHLMGTDALGRDNLLRISEGLRVTLFVGCVATILATAVGSAWGAFAAMAGGRVDATLMRIADGMNALPMVLVVVLITLYAGRGLGALMIAIGAFAWVTLARVVRARLLEVRGRDYVKAARLAGAGAARVWWRHYLPQASSTIVAYTALNLPSILILEATLSYLGLGVQAPNASLGILLKEGAEGMTVAPWMLFFPAVIFVGLLATVNATAEKLRKNIEK